MVATAPDLSPFLQESFVDELTGIRKGKGGKSKHNLQCAFLRAEGIPFVENMRGRPIVNRSYFERPAISSEPPRKKTWEPYLNSR